MSSLLKIDPAQYGLTETKAKEVAAMFTPMLEKMQELESEYNNIIQLPISKETCQQAKALRLQYVKVRTGTAKIHKELKAFYLQGGRFVDGWKNAQLMASQGIEERLSKIENHFINLEKERIEKLRVERVNLLEPFEQEEIPGLGEMQENVFQNFLSGVKAAHQAKIEAEQKAEAERIAKEKAEREERERIRIENERLRKEAEEKEKQLQAEREKAEAILKAEREKAEAILKAEREKQAKIEAELKAKKEAEEKRIAEEKARIEEERKAKKVAERKAKAAPDKEKIMFFAEKIKAIDFPEMSSEEGKTISKEIQLRLSSLIEFIEKQARQ